MSGGSYNYLYRKDAMELLSLLAGQFQEQAIDDLRKALSTDVYMGIGKPRRKITDEERAAVNLVLVHVAQITSAANALASLTEKLSEVLHALEWTRSGDSGADYIWQECVEFAKKGLAARSVCGECKNVGAHKLDCVTGRVGEATRKGQP